jgi:hypothetical protein
MNFIHWSVKTVVLISSPLHRTRRYVVKRGRYTRNLSWPLNSFLLILCEKKSVFYILYVPLIILYETVTISCDESVASSLVSWMTHEWRRERGGGERDFNTSVHEGGVILWVRNFFDHQKPRHVWKRRKERDSVVSLHHCHHDSPFPSPPARGPSSFSSMSKQGSPVVVRLSCVEGG